MAAVSVVLPLSKLPLIKSEPNELGNARENDFKNDMKVTPAASAGPAPDGRYRDVQLRSVLPSVPIKYSLTYVSR